MAKVLESESVSPSFEVASCLSGWSRRGEEGFSFSSKVVRSYPDSDLTNGFFVALLVKKGYQDIAKDEILNIDGDTVGKKRKGKAVTSGEKSRTKKTKMQRT